MGRLYLVPTPIGNLKDISLRAIEILNMVDLILVEDTRVTLKLLNHYDISKPLKKFSKDNEHKVIEYWVGEINSGKNLALLTDAGTPGISDPGFLMVRACIDAQIELECLTGPVAFVPALVASGLPCERFCFEGFLPHKKGRQKKLVALTEEPRTIVFYESPNRIKKLIHELNTYFGGDRKACISREISKKFEEHLRGSLLDLSQYLENNILKGEIVVIVEGKTEIKKVKKNKYRPENGH